MLPFLWEFLCDLHSDFAVDLSCFASGSGAGSDGILVHQEGLFAWLVHHRGCQGQLFPVLADIVPRATGVAQLSRAGAHRREWG